MFSGTDIQGRARKCIELFRDCASSPLLGRLKWVRTGQADFNLWAWGLNATSTGKASLDYRVRQRADVLSVICDLLDGLVETLQDGLIQAATTVSASSDQTNFGPTATSDAFEDLEFDTKTILKQLSRIHVAIRKAGTKLRYRRADDTLQDALKDEGFQVWKEDMENLLLVGTKRFHPAAPPTEETATKAGHSKDRKQEVEKPTVAETHVISSPTLKLLEQRTLGLVQQRLIRANLIRRHRIQVATETLRAARRHAEKQRLHEAEQQVLPVGEKAPKPTALKADEAPKETGMKDTINTMQHLVMSTASPDVAKDVASENESKAQRTATEFPSEYKVDLAPSRKSATIITKATQTGREQDYPRWPKKIESDEDIPCPYCAEPLAAGYVRDDARWRGHLAGDLAPYVCIIENCPAEDALFVTTEDLNKHVRQEHGIQCWVCNYCADQLQADQTMIFDTAQDWVSHVRNTHFKNMKTSQIEALSDLSIRTMIEEMECPLGALCDFSKSTVQSEINPHITGHMHEFALRALPWGISDKQSDSKSLNSGAKSERDTDDEADDSENLKCLYDKFDFSNFLDSTELDRGRGQTLLHDVLYKISIPNDLIDAMYSINSKLRDEEWAGILMEERWPRFGMTGLLRICGMLLLLQEAEKQRNSQDNLQKGETYRDWSFTEEMIAELHSSLRDETESLVTLLEECLATRREGYGSTNIPEDHESTALAEGQESTPEEKIYETSHYGSTSDEEENLSEKLHKCMIRSKFDKTPQDFVPEGVLDRMITRHSILAAMRVETPTPEDGQLVQFVLGKAKKLFAISAFIGFEEDRLLRRVMLLFMEHYFDDTKLPVEENQHSYPLSKADDAHDIFFSLESSVKPKKKIWRRVRVYDFYANQWKFLAPVLSTAQLNYDFAEQSIVPFIRKQTIYERGAFSQINQYEIHPDHIRDPIKPGGPCPTVFAVKEILPMGKEDYQRTASHWEAEVRALEKMNALHQDHIVRFITAFRRFHNDGVKDHYLVFEWADGGNLRDLWGAIPQPSFGTPLVKAVIKQLLGLAEALSAAHYPPNDHTAYRHGDLKPANILWFQDGEEIGKLKIGDWGEAKGHNIVTEFRDSPTVTEYGTRRYEAPEVETGMRSTFSGQSRQRRSRLYDIWTMGCITLEVIVWLVYGLKELEHFNRSVRGEFGESSPLYQISIQNEKRVARVHDVAVRWMNHMAGESACQVGTTALGDLLELVRTGLLVVKLPRRLGSKLPNTDSREAPTLGIPPISINIPSIDINPAEPSGVVPDGPARIRADEFASRLRNILEEEHDESYWNKVPSMPAPERFHDLSRLPTEGEDDHYTKETASHLSPEEDDRLARVDIVAPQQERVDYAHPLLDENEWHFQTDNDFASKLFSTFKTSSSFPIPEPRVSAHLCTECKVFRNELFNPGFSVTYNVSELMAKAEHNECDLCGLLWEACKIYDGRVFPRVLFERTGSTLTMNGSARPVLSIFRSLELNTRQAENLQIGFSELLEAGTSTHLEVIRQWLKHCDDEHRHSSCKPANQAIRLENQEVRRMPKRLIDVNGIDSDGVRLREISASDTGNWITLSFVWGSKQPFQTTTSSFAHHKRGMKLETLPPTFQDAVRITRALGLRYLWIDAICIIQDSIGDWKENVACMEDVFSGAYCVLAANSAPDSSSGFLRVRYERESVALCRENEAPFYISRLIDDFKSHVLGSNLCRRAWALQEHALARRTIFFTVHQTYWECGDGVRCETMTKMRSNSAALLGDPNFPRLLLDAPQGERILRCQQLYATYSRLMLTRPLDRPIAIEGLERRLLRTMGIKGGFGVFDGEARGLLHRSLLWHRGPDTDSLPRIRFTAGSTVPSWSWMACSGGINYFQPEFGGYEWEDVGSPWSRSGDEISHDEISASHISLTAVARRYDLASYNDSEGLLIFDEPGVKGTQHPLCVVLGKQKGATSLRDQRHYLLIVMPSETASDNRRPIYERVGAGCLPVRCIAPSGVEVSIQ